jgi:hypothetical protein
MIDKVSKKIQKFFDCIIGNPAKKVAKKVKKTRRRKKKRMSRK